MGQIAPAAFGWLPGKRVARRFRGAGPGASLRRVSHAFRARSGVERSESEIRRYRDPFEQAVGIDQKTPFRSAARSALRQPPLSATGTWLPIGQQLWLEHLSDEKFPPLQAPKSDNLSEILEQVKRRAISRLRGTSYRGRAVRRCQLTARSHLRIFSTTGHLMDRPARPVEISRRRRADRCRGAAGRRSAPSGCLERVSAAGRRIGRRPGTGGPRVSLRPTSPRTDPPCSNRGRRRFSSPQRVWVSNGSLHDNNFQPPLFATDKTSDESARVPHGGHGPVTFRWRGTRPRSESMT
jgi:hypothetical protein